MLTALKKKKKIGCKEFLSGLSIDRGCHLKGKLKRRMTWKVAQLPVFLRDANINPSLSRDATSKVVTNMPSKTIENRAPMKK